MNRWITNGIGLSAMGALCFCAWAFYQAGSAVRENRQNLLVASAGAREALNPHGAGMPTIFNEARDITIAILKPCKPGKPETCGLIPAVRDVAVNAGAATVAMQRQIEQTEPLIQSAAIAVQDTSQHLNKTIDAATETTLQARTDLGTLNESLAATRPLIEAYTRSGNNLNALLERPAIPQLVDSAAALTSNAAGISADAKRIADKLTADYFSTQPWYKKIGRYASDAFDYGALFARHVP